MAMRPAGVHPVAMKDAVIISAVRTAVGKAPAGMLRTTRPDEMAAAVLAEALRRAPALDPAEIDDVILGCAMPEAEQGLNVARIASLRAGIPIGASAVTVNRFCASGLQAIAQAAERIASGQATAILAGGTESMSLVPMGGHKVSPNPALVASRPDVYLTTGLVAENHARESHIPRDAQDAFALESHHRAIAAIDAGRFNDEILPLPVTLAEPAAGNGAPAVRTESFAVDEGPRRDTSAEALAKLRPAFHVAGSVTAGNSSQMSDGAAAVLVVEAGRARDLGLTPIARFVGYATAGVEPERFGIGPVPAVKKVLARAGLRLDDIELVELNEAFAAQVLACLQELPIDPRILNVNGGAIALGHPLGCTGAKLTTTLVHELRRRRGRYGLVTMCVGGGMGAAGIFERM
jgi:acetyl-CoA acyltransferase